MCPGFASDCIETLEEIEIRAKEVFLKNGGKNFLMLNDSVYLLDERITQWMNGAKREDLDDEGFVQGSLSL